MTRVSGRLLLMTCIFASAVIALALDDQIVDSIIPEEEFTEDIMAHPTEDALPRSTELAPETSSLKSSSPDPAAEDLVQVAPCKDQCAPTGGMTSSACQQNVFKEWETIPGYPATRSGATLMAAVTNPCTLSTFIAGLKPGEGYYYSTWNKGWCRSIPAANVAKVRERKQKSTLRPTLAPLWTPQSAAYKDYVTLPVMQRYCNNYKPGGKFHGRCTAGAPGHQTALDECKETCGLCPAPPKPVFDKFQGSPSSFSHWLGAPVHPCFGQSLEDFKATMAPGVGFYYHPAKWTEQFVKYYTTDGTLSYAQSKAKCEWDGNHLCSRATLCPDGHSGGQKPAGGLQTDQWGPVSDSDNAWVSLGGHWPSCQLHSEINGGAYGKPGWGVTSNRHGFRTKLPCCKTARKGGCRDRKGVSKDTKFQSKITGYPTYGVWLMSAAKTPCTLSTFIAGLNPGEGYYYDKVGNGWCRSIPAANVARVSSLYIQSFRAWWKWTKGSGSAGVYLPVTRRYCDNYGPGEQWHSRCTPGAAGHQKAIDECEETCGLCRGECRPIKHTSIYNTQLDPVKATKEVMTWQRPGHRGQAGCKCGWDKSTGWTVLPGQPNSVVRTPLLRLAPPLKSCASQGLQPQQNEADCEAACRGWGKTYSKNCFLHLTPNCHVRRNADGTFSNCHWNTCGTVYSTVYTGQLGSSVSYPEVCSVKPAFKVRTQDEAETLKMRLCDKGFICVYTVSLSFDTTQVKNSNTDTAKAAAAMTYDIKVKPAKAPDTFEIEGESYTTYDRFNGHPSADNMGPTTSACNLEDFESTLADNDGFYYNPEGKECRSIPAAKVAGVRADKSWQGSKREPKATFLPRPDSKQSKVFKDCFDQATRHVIQDNNGNVEMLAKSLTGPQSGLKKPCSGYQSHIQGILAGTVEALATAYGSAKNSDLMEFSETVPDVNGLRTTHYRREKHDDGSETIHHERTWEHPPEPQPVPQLLQKGLKMNYRGKAASSSMEMRASGRSTKKPGDALFSKSTNQAESKLGSSSGEPAWACKPETSLVETDAQSGLATSQRRRRANADGMSCDTNEVPQGFKGEESVRVKDQTRYNVRLKSRTAVTELVQTMPMDEFLQSHASAGLKPVPILQAITAHGINSDPFDETSNVDYTKVMQELVEIGNSNPDSFEPGGLRDTVHQLMMSPKIRAQAVKDLAKNEIKSARVVQSLMHAIGSAAIDQPEATDQLIELASTTDIDETAASQALVALLQARCYNHDNAIRGLTKLARPDAQTSTQIMAVHIQHGLMAHAEHCANNKYTEATAHKYNDVLAETHKHLQAAVARGDDAAAWVLLEAIGNTQSQRRKETDVLITVANSGHLKMETQMMAVQNLGKLYTPQALVALKELATHPTYTGTHLQQSCEKAISGEHLADGDERKPETKSQDASLSQTDVAAASVTSMGTKKLGGKNMKVYDATPGRYDYGNEKVFDADRKAQDKAHNSNMLKKADNDAQENAKRKEQGKKAKYVCKDKTCAPKIGIKFSKKWDFPAKGDIRAQPGVGIVFDKQYNYANKEGNVFCLHGYAGIDAKVWEWTQSVIKAGAKKCHGFKFYAYFEVLGIKIWEREKTRKKKNGKVIEEKSQKEGKKFAPPIPGVNGVPPVAPDKQGHCGTNVNSADLIVELRHDITFLEKKKLFILGIFLVEAHFKVAGEIGFKGGYSSMASLGAPAGIGKDEPSCKSQTGKMLFGIPYAQATLAARLELNLLVAKVGGGVDVVIVKVSLPATNEQLSDKSCGGCYLHVSALGGQIYIYVDVLGFPEITWGGIKLRYNRVKTWIIYKWRSPAEWKSSDIKCKASNGAVTHTEIIKGKPTMAPTFTPTYSKATIDNTISLKHLRQRNLGIFSGMEIELHNHLRKRKCSEIKSGCDKWWGSDSPEGKPMEWSIYTNAQHENMDVGWKLYWKGGTLKSGSEVFLWSNNQQAWLCSNFHKDGGVSLSKAGTGWDHCQPDNPQFSWKLHYGSQSYHELQSEKHVWLEANDPAQRRGGALPYLFPAGSGQMYYGRRAVAKAFIIKFKGKFDGSLSGR